MPDFPLLTFIDAIYVINLEHRTDRRAEVEQQLARIGLDFDHPKVRLFPAVCPQDCGEFPNIGSRGCFLSHLNILKDAYEREYECIFILEDDADFTSLFCNITTDETALIRKTKWEIFHLGSLYAPDEKTDADYGFFTSIVKSAPLKLTHAILFKKPAIKNLIPYFETMLTRKSGDPLGGPMHVDGAYGWFRSAHPEITTMATKTQWLTQRSSKTDIHDPSWKEHIPMINVARRIKNKLMRN